MRLTALLQSYRWIADSRAATCPKGLNPAQAIGNIKQMLVKRSV